MQKLPVSGARDEFISSVPSSCHCTSAESTCAPSGTPPGGFPFARNITFQKPTIVGPDSSGPNFFDTGRERALGIAEGLFCRGTGPSSSPGTQPALAEGAKAIPNVITANPMVKPLI